MQARWPEAKIVGLDNSADMLAKAQDAHPDITWIEAEIELVARGAIRPRVLERSPPLGPGSRRTFPRYFEMGDPKRLCRDTDALQFRSPQPHHSLRDDSQW